MEDNIQNNERNFDLASFSRVKDKMIATNESAYRNVFRNACECLYARHHEYTPEEVVDIIESGSLAEQQKLSRYFYRTDGYYKHLVTHYATLLRFMGLLIPNPSAGKNLSTSHIQKRYFNAMELVNAMQLPVWLPHCALRALIDGCYYGVRVDTDKNTFAVLDLPAQFCCSRFKDTSGNDLIEFDLTYFNTVTTTESAREAALEAFPKVIAKAYRKYAKGNLSSNWFIIPSDIGVCLPLFDGVPLFLSAIPATLAYDDAIKNRAAKEAEDIRKIIVQQIPHLSDGRLLFEPDEAEEIHAGTVGMLQGDKNISVLTTYADVDAIVSKTTDEDSSEFLKQSERNIYAEAGVSGEIFASTNSATLPISLQNDLAIMMTFANKASVYITNVVNAKWSNSNITFKYQIADVSYYNESAFIENSFKLVGSGYSVLMPALAQGLSQQDLVNVKNLENDVLKLGDILKPLSTSYTQSSSGNSPDNIESGNTNPDKGGRPTKEATEKTEETIKVEESIDKTGGGS